MFYIGAVDYWFWYGIQCGYLGSYSNPEEYLKGRLLLINKTNRDCSIAFKDGFYIGEELTIDEYIDLTTIEKPVIINETKEQVVEVITDNNQTTVEINEKFPFSGNC